MHQLEIIIKIKIVDEITRLLHIYDFEIADHHLGPKKLNYDEIKNCDIVFDHLVNRSVVSMLKFGEMSVAPTQKLGF